MIRGVAAHGIEADVALTSGLRPPWRQRALLQQPRNDVVSACTAGARTSCARHGRCCTRSGATQRTSLTEGACGSVADHGQVLRLLPLSRRQQVVHLSRLWQWRAVGSDRHARVTASHGRSSRPRRAACTALRVDPAATVSELDRVTCASRGAGWRLVPGARLVGVHYSRGNDPRFGPADGPRPSHRPGHGTAVVFRGGRRGM